MATSFEDFLKIFKESQGLDQPAVTVPYRKESDDLTQLPPLGNMIGGQQNITALPSGSTPDESQPFAEPAAPAVTPDLVAKLKAFTGSRSPAVVKDAASVAGAAPVNLADTEFTDAKEKARQNRMYAGLQAASSQIGNSIASLGAGSTVKPDSSGQDFLMKTADAPIKDLETQRAAQKTHLDLIDDVQKNDPNSAVSKMMRDTLLRLSPGMKIPDNFTASQAEKVFPSVAKALEAKNMEEMRKLQYATLAEAKSARTQTKADELTIKRIGEIAKKLPAEMASSRSAFGSAARNLQTIQNAEALLNGETNLDNLDTRQMSELARVLDRVLSGGTPTISGTEHLTPQSASAYIAKFQEQISNMPVGAGQGKFAEKIKHTFDREKRVAANQILAGQTKILGGVSDIAKAHPDLLEGVMEANGLKGKFNNKGVFVPDIGDDDTHASASDPKIDAYAKAHNLQYNQAENILKARGYNGK